MIVQEQFTVNGQQFVRSYSSLGVKVHGGSPEADYDEACDPADLGRTYTETDIPIEDDTAAEDILNIIMGAEE